MKIAITSTGNTDDSIIDQRFGRCAYFAIYDYDSHLMEFIRNPNRDAEEGAGPASVEFVALHKVSKIVSGEFGMKIRSLLDSLQIQTVVVKEPEKKIRDIVELFKS
ncbi:MAG: NifB/NifX family molybdenum-iron cluster-binding protein [Bacteroidales bacterium]